MASRLTLTGQAYSSQNDVRYDNVAFVSSNERVVRIKGDGRLTAVGAGTATITARAGTATSTLAVEVIAGTVARVAIEPATQTARTGDVVRFAATGTQYRAAPIDKLRRLRMRLRRLKRSLRNAIHDGRRRPRAAAPTA
jgi:plastocyanin